MKDNKEQLNDEIGLVEKRLSDLKQHLGELKSALGETGWEVKQKNGEIAMLKNQLKDVLNTGREAQNQVRIKLERIVVVYMYVRPLVGRSHHCGGLNVSNEF